MTDREFDDLLKAAFDRYAKEKLDKLPADAELDSAMTIRRQQKISPLRRAVGVILVAACLALMSTSALLISDLATPDKSPIQNILPPNSYFDATSTAASSKSENYGTSIESYEPSQTTLTTPAEISDAITLPNFHEVRPTLPLAGGTGYFADISLIKNELTQLDSLTSNISTDVTFDKKGGGSAYAWFGSVHTSIHYDQPVMPIAITLTFGDKQLCPRECILMASDSGGNMVELLTYSSKLTEDNVSVGFYIDSGASDVSDMQKYSDYYLSYNYVAMPSEDYEIPHAELYGFEDGEERAFDFAEYYVSSGKLYMLTTNAVSLALPDSFAGYTLTTLKEGSVSGKNTVNLTSLSLPEGVDFIESRAFNSVSSLESITLPTSLVLDDGSGNLTYNDGKNSKELEELFIGFEKLPTVSVNAADNASEDASESKLTKG